MRGAIPAAATLTAHSTCRCAQATMSPSQQSPAVPTLYHVPTFCSSILCQLIHELNIPSTEIAIKTITKEELATSPTIAKISPRRVVPVLQFPDGSSMVEGGAIVLYLMETYDKHGKLHALPGTDKRCKFLQGIVYAFSEAHGACLRYVKSMVSHEDGVFRILKESERDEKKVEEGRLAFEKNVAGHLASELEGFYLGDEVSAVDFCFTWVFATVEFVEGGVHISEKVRDWFDRMKGMDSFHEIYLHAQA